jgi:hypothetical protein
MIVGFHYEISISIRYNRLLKLNGDIILRGVASDCRLAGGSGGSLIGFSFGAVARPGNFAGAGFLTWPLRFVPL